MITFNNYLVESEHLDQVNDQLSQKLDNFVSSLSGAFEILIETLSAAGLSFELSEYDEEGDELVFDLNSGETSTGLFLYVIYYRTDDGQYDFYAEVTDEEGLDELMSEDEDE